MSEEEASLRHLWQHALCTLESGAQELQEWLGTFYWILDVESELMHRNQRQTQAEASWRKDGVCSIHDQIFCCHKIHSQ